MYGPVRTVVWQGSAGDRRPYADQVGIAELKAHLSEYLRAVRKGREIVIKDRETAIAKITPLQERRLPFATIPAKKPLKSLDELHGVALTGVTPEVVERVFAETRADRVDEWLNWDKSTWTRR